MEQHLCDDDGNDNRKWDCIHTKKSKSMGRNHVIMAKKSICGRTKTPKYGSRYTKI